MKATHRKASAKPLAARPLAACVLSALAATLNGGISAFAQTPYVRSTKAGSTLSVTNCADDGSTGTLRSAIANAASGATVDLSQLDCSKITLQSGQIEVHVDDLTLTGPGRDLLEIDAHDASRVLLFSGQGTLTVNGLTLTHGRADTAIPSNPPTYEMVGGCVLSTVRHFAGIKMTDAAVTHCTAIDGAGTSYAAAGGGIYAQGPINLTRVIVSNNTASDTSSTAGVAAGGGIMSKVGAVTLTDSIVQGNVAVTRGRATGGGIFGWLSDVALTNSVIDGNFAGCDTATSSCAQADGGGIATDGSNLDASLSVLSNNTASASGKVRGGGAMPSGFFHHFNDSQISGNQALSATAQASGGGAYTFGGSVGIRGSTISGNSADGGIGGGIFVYYGDLTVRDSTVSGNSAGNAGAIYNAHVNGYYASNLPVTLFNSTITANTATMSSAPGGVTGGLLDTQTYLNHSGPFQSSIVAGNAAPNADPAKADLIVVQEPVNGANNLVVAAQGATLPTDTINADPLLGPLQDNGGPTLTHALLPGSPAIDAGNHFDQDLVYDQRGEGFPRSFGIAPDIGAFERTITPSTCYRKLRPPC